MQNLTYTQANRGANISLVMAFIAVFTLGVLTGVLYNPAIINFINSLIQ